MNERKIEILNILHDESRLKSCCAEIFGKIIYLFLKISSLLFHFAVILVVLHYTKLQWKFCDKFFPAEKFWCYRHEQNLPGSIFKQFIAVVLYKEWEFSWWCWLYFLHAVKRLGPSGSQSTLISRWCTWWPSTISTGVYMSFSSILYKNY